MRITLRIEVTSTPEELRDLKEVLEPDFRDWSIKLEENVLIMTRDEISPSRARALSVSLFRAIELFYNIRRLKDNL